MQPHRRSDGRRRGRPDDGGRAQVADALGVVDELRDLVAAQQAALATREATRAGATASRGCQTDAAPTDEEERLAARVRELEDRVAAEAAERRAAQMEQEKAAMEASSSSDDAMGQAPKKRKIKVKHPFDAHSGVPGLKLLLLDPESPQ